MNRLHELRKTAQITLQEAARAAGVSYSTLWNAEHGYSNLSDETAETLRTFYVTEILARAQRVTALLDKQ